MQFDNASVVCLADIWFDGRVVSHTVYLMDETRKALVVMQPGEYAFESGPAERLEVTGGNCELRLEGESEWRAVPEGGVADVGEESRYSIRCEGVVQYVRTFEDELRPEV